MRSKGADCVVVARIGKIDGSNSLFSDRAPILHAPYARAASFIKLQMNIQGSAHARTRARSISAAEN
jgi:hypothetical protein